MNSQNMYTKRRHRYSTVLFSGSLALTLLADLPLARAQQASDQPCGMGEIKRDAADGSKVLINFSGRTHFKYEGPLSTADSSIMVAEGHVYRYVREGEQMRTVNLGTHLPLAAGQPIKLDSGNTECLIALKSQAGEAVLDVQMLLKFLSAPTTRQYQLPVPK
jgi:hypothetical protein